MRIVSCVCCDCLTGTSLQVDVDVSVNQHLEVSRESETSNQSFSSSPPPPPPPPEPVVQSTLSISPILANSSNPTQSDEATSSVVQQQIQLAGNPLQQVYHPIGPFALYVNTRMTRVPPNMNSMCEMRILEVITLCENGHDPVVNVANLE